MCTNSWSVFCCSRTRRVGYCIRWLSFMNWMLLRPYTGIPTDCNISYKRSISIFDRFIDNGIGNGIEIRWTRIWFRAWVDPLPHPQGIHLGYGCGVRNQFRVDKLPAFLCFSEISITWACSLTAAASFFQVMLAGCTFHYLYYRASKLALSIGNDDTIGWTPLRLYQLL